MKKNSLEITKYIQTARKKQKEGNIYQANEIYKNLINQKIYTYDLLISYGLFCKEINNLKIAKNLFILSIKKYPSRIESYILLAEIFRKENNFNNALKTLHAAQKIKNVQSDIDYNLSLTYKTIKLEIGEKKNKNVWIKMSLIEGKNREIRKIMSHFGCKVNRLIRVGYGPFILKDLIRKTYLKLLREYRRRNVGYYKKRE